MPSAPTLWIFHGLIFAQARFPGMGAICAGLHGSLEPEMTSDRGMQHLPSHIPGPEFYPVGLFIHLMTQDPLVD